MSNIDLNGNVYRNTQEQVLENAKQIEEIKAQAIIDKTALQDDINAVADDLDNHIDNHLNPHQVTKEQVGLGDVVNTGDSATPVENGATKFTTGGAYTELAKKQNVIDSSHKLSADLVDDTSTTNKFVTTTEKDTWNGKQNALVSGTNIKTINNTSLLGSGDISIPTPHLYIHHIYLDNDGDIYGTAIVISTSPTQYNYSTFASYLETNGYVNKYKGYPLCARFTDEQDYIPASGLYSVSGNIKFMSISIVGGAQVEEWITNDNFTDTVVQLF